MRNPIGTVVLVPWYERDDFEALRQLAGTEPRFPPDYDTWLRSAVGATEKLLAQGCTAVPLTIRSADYLAWLETTGRSNGAASRLRFLREIARSQGIGSVVARTDIGVNGRGAR